MAHFLLTASACGKALDKRCSSRASSALSLHITTRLHSSAASARVHVWCTCARRGQWCSLTRLCTRQFSLRFSSTSRTHRRNRFAYKQQRRGEGRSAHCRHSRRAPSPLIQVRCAGARRENNDVSYLGAHNRQSVLRRSAGLACAPPGGRGVRLCTPSAVDSCRFLVSLGLPRESVWDLQVCG